jgi:hypothetical protein
MAGSPPFVFLKKINNIVIDFQYVEFHLDLLIMTSGKILSLIFSQSFIWTLFSVGSSAEKHNLIQVYLISVSMVF